MIFHKVLHSNKTTQWFLELDGEEGKGSDLAAIINYALQIFSNGDVSGKMNTILWHDGDVSMFMTFLYKWTGSLLEANSNKYLMQENCSFFPLTKNDVNIIETKEIKLLGDHDKIKNGFGIVNPKDKLHIDKPRFIQWRGKKHWYCKIGNMDVVVDGKQSWNTKDKAKLAFKKWKILN